MAHSTLLVQTDAYLIDTRLQHLLDNMNHNALENYREPYRISRLVLERDDT